MPRCSCASSPGRTRRRCAPTADRFLARRPGPWKARGRVHFRLALAPFMAALAGCASVQPLPAPTPELPLAAWEGPEVTDANAVNGRHAQRSAAPALAKTAEHRGADAPS